MVISDNNISTEVWSQVRTKLVAASLTASNSSTSTTYAANINASYNDKSGARPQVIINPVVGDEGGFKFQGTEGKKMINVVVDIYASQSLYVDQLSDQVKSALKPNDIAGIDLVGVAEDYAFSDPGDQKFHLKSLTFAYMRE